MEFKISDKIAWRKIDGLLYIVTIPDSYLHLLNETSTLIWELIVKDKNKTEIVKNICNEFDVEPAVAEKDIKTFLSQLKQKGIIKQ